MAPDIARAAARLFARRGYDATSVREIVEAAGVTKPTLYYHFGSKEGLAQALLTVPMEAFVARLLACLGASNDPVDDLIAQIDAHFDFCRESPDRARFVYALFFGPLGSELSSELARFAEGITAVLLQGVDRLASARVIDPAGVGSFATACRGMIVIHSMDFLYQSAELGPDLARTIVSDLLRGFGAGTEVLRTRGLQR